MNLQNHRSFRLTLLFTAGALLAIPAVAGASEPTPSHPAAAAAQPATVYTCPMHPEVIADKPGKCPKCGMKLVPKDPPAGKK